MFPDSDFFGLNHVLRLWYMFRSFVGELFQTPVALETSTSFRGGREFVTY
jgi:hypothetical protein